MKAVVDRLLEKMRCAESGCWEWIGTRKSDGYGLMRYPRKYVGAHRISYQEFVGPIPDGFHVLHRCDNPCCINPAHLFAGTNADNVADKMAKGRRPSTFGEANPKARLKAADVLEIRASAEAGVALAKKYGVTPTQISEIRHRKSWGHL